MHILIGRIAQKLRIHAAGRGKLLRLGSPEEDEIDRRGRPSERGGEGRENRDGCDGGGEPLRHVLANGLGWSSLRLASQESARAPGKQRGDGGDDGDAPAHVGKRQQGHCKRDESGAGAGCKDRAAGEGEAVECGMREQGRSHGGKKDEGREPGHSSHQGRLRSQTLPSGVSRSSLPGSGRGLGPTTTRYSASRQTSGARNRP